MKKWLGLIALIVIAGTATWFVYRPAPNSSVTKPKPTPSYVDATLAKMSLEDKIASLLVMGMDGTDPAALGEFVSTYKLGGFILMSTNIPGRTQPFARKPRHSAAVMQNCRVSWRSTRKAARSSGCRAIRLPAR